MAASAIGAYIFGTLSLVLSRPPELGRSIEGAIIGAVLGVEIFKSLKGIATSTGARFALPLAPGVAVGRIGCYLSALDDFTYGTPTMLPWAWAHDFGG